jgi:outer membrane protein OmpA-like peptidoglycan-associated protein
LPTPGSTPPSGTPAANATPSTEAGRRAEQERKDNPGVPINKVEQGDLNDAAARLLNKVPSNKPPTKPADAKLTPWVAPEVVTDPDQAEKSGDKPVLVMPPPGATPTPTPAPERIVVQDPSTIIKNIQNTTLAPTPPPAPTPGPTPVATPPGVTPVPSNFRPDNNWVPYPGWRPPTNWNPPKGWTPPGGWTPPPGWNPPREWVPRLRQWGWSYIPRRGWVVPVQWTPPPDFVVPPNWYYMPSYAYDDYGLYDPSQVVVLSGHARPDLQVNINVTEVYMPPAPPPVQVLDAPPPPPRPAPPEPPMVPQEVTSVQTVAQVLSRPRIPNAPRYQGPVLVTGSVHFDYDKYAIKPESFPTLDAIGQTLVTEMPDAILNVEGHTDSDGSDEYNQTLSEQRAWSVKSYLVQKFGLDPNRLIIVGYGERAPIADNATDEGKARNRRVEFENVTDLYKAQVVDTGQVQ